jgi:hypothetical protein
MPFDIPGVKRQTYLLIFNLNDSMNKSITVFLLLMATLFSCTDPTKLGADLLEEDQISAGFTDTLNLISYTVEGDSVRTYTELFSGQLNSYLFGDFTSPVFGRSVSTLYVQARLPRDASLGVIEPEFKDSDLLDSIVLVLPYDTIAYYGLTNEVFGIEVLELAESMVDTIDYYSNQTFQTLPVSIGSKFFIPKKDSVEIITYTGTNPDTVKVPMQLRIPLNQMWGSAFLFRDTSTYKSDEAFLNFFKGMQLKPSSQNGGIISFNLKSSAAGVYIYYTRDGKGREYQLPFNALAARVANYVNDHSGTPVASFISNRQLGDSLVFVQGMKGLNTVIEIPNVQSLKGLIVNKAELELFVDGSGNNVNYPSLEYLSLLYPRSGDTLQVVSDIALSGNDRFNVFGGVFEKGTLGRPAVYRMNISAHFQDMIDGLVSNKLIITAFPKPEDAAFVTLLGAKHSLYPIRLKVAYTNVQ